MFFIFGLIGLFVAIGCDSNHIGWWTGLATFVGFVFDISLADNIQTGVTRTNSDSSSYYSGGGDAGGFGGGDCGGGGC